MNKKRKGGNIGRALELGPFWIKKKIINGHWIETVRFCIVRNKRIWAGILKWAWLNKRRKGGNRSLPLELGHFEYKKNGSLGRFTRFTDSTSSWPVSKGENPGRKDYRMTVGPKLKFKTILYIYIRKNLREKIEDKKEKKKIGLKLINYFYVYLF